MSWKAECNIHQHLKESDNLTEESPLPEKIRRDILNELTSLPKEYSTILSEEIERLQDRDGIYNIGDLNQWLDDLYDVADTYRIWLGPSKS